MSDHVLAAGNNLMAVVQSGVGDNGSVDPKEGTVVEQTTS